jgi:putative transcriptional regulator
VNTVAVTTVAVTTVQIAEAAPSAPVIAAKPAPAPRARLLAVAHEVRGLRERHGLSQAEFARRFGFELDTIRKYEQGHRQPTGPARSLLRVIAAEPEAVKRALAQPARHAVDAPA